MKSKAKNKKAGIVKISKQNRASNTEAINLGAKDLLARGFEVYGSLSPNNSFDLVV